MSEKIIIETLLAEPSIIILSSENTQLLFLMPLRYVGVKFWAEKGKTTIFKSCRFEYKFSTVESEHLHIFIKNICL